jgi:hypothetical protein
MQIVFKFPYKDFRMNGQPVLGEIMCDGNLTQNSAIGDLDKILAVHGKEDQVSFVKLDNF